VAQVIVPDYQLSLAIGKEGQNARLAHRLTGWKIDIHPDTEGTGEPVGDPSPAGNTGGARRVPPSGRGVTDAPAR
jgi:N utilization substance protein A